MFRTTVVLALTAAIAAAPAAGAATKNGITPVTPKAGKSVPAGKSPKFKMRVRGSGQVWVHVCASAKKDADGVICSTASIGQAKKSGSLFVYTPKFFDFPEFWLNTPGTYHWQAHRIACEGGDTSDCKQEGPVVKFKVK
ncbi:hypothetical protein LRS13_24770 [Svornostia abyssi]|uniref:Uncharacterized protein n=1 Tax=Svornostia abyssi TaxID=2898438 RepID=A0ABY5PGP2_9ACTN|nr:hypothetical protein LRS13_24770 [Parviterribacteraceae bacterium J379]